MAKSKEYVFNNDETCIKLTITGDSGLPGRFYLSFVYDKIVVCFDGKGNFVWSDSEPQQAADAHAGFWDFKKTVCRNTVYYSYHKQTEGFGADRINGYAPGKRIIMDAGYNIIDCVQLVKSNLLDPKASLAIDGHDFIMLGKEHFIMSSYQKATVTNIPGHPEPAEVLYSYLQEVKAGKVLWEWRSIDHPELYGLVQTDADPQAADFSTTPDYVHFNSMQIDKDGHLICSFRHLDTIMKLNRKNGEIMWRLSGKGDQFGLTSVQKSSGQHYARLNDTGYLTAFNNGNAVKSTQINAWKVNQAARKLDAFKTYTLGGKFSLACGSVQHIKDEVYVIGWGWSQNDHECMTVYDFAKGQTLMSVELSATDGEVDTSSKHFTYRCAYYD